MSFDQFSDFSNCKTIDTVKLNDVMCSDDMSIKDHISFTQQQQDEWFSSKGKHKNDAMKSVRLSIEEELVKTLDDQEVVKKLEKYTDLKTETPETPSTQELENSQLSFESRRSKSNTRMMNNIKEAFPKLQNKVSKFVDFTNNLIKQINDKNKRIKCLEEDLNKNSKSHDDAKAQALSSVQSLKNIKALLSQWDRIVKHQSNISRQYEDKISQISKNLREKIRQNKIYSIQLKHSEQK